MSTVRPYGSWPSPISAELIVGGLISLSDVAVVDDNMYWVEGRPAEKGRRVLVGADADGTVSDVVPPELNVRTRVHEYGGVAHLVLGTSVFVLNDSDQRLYRLDPGADPRPITPLGYRYADLSSGLGPRPDRRRPRGPHRPQPGGDQHGRRPRPGRRQRRRR
jgi:hypothetical protein